MTAGTLADDLAPPLRRGEGGRGGGTPGGEGSPEVKELVGYQLRRAHTLFALHWQMNSQLAVTPVQGGMLVEISRNPGISQADLARLMSVEGPTLIQTIDRLEGAGLIRRERPANDRRRYALHATPSGEKTVAAVRRFVSQRDDALLGGLDDDERHQLLMLLQRVVKRSQSVVDQSIRGKVRGA